jgi:uncharacterized protein (DUF433 family)
MKMALSVANIVRRFTQGEKDKEAKESYGTASLFHIRRLY